MPRKRMAAKAAKATARSKQPTAKPAKAADARGPSPEVERQLAAAAKEINVRLEKAAQIEGKADDHRLAAALKLAEAKAVCKDNKMPFKKWVAAHVDKSYDEVRKLAVVGEAPEPAKALEDLRSGAAKRNKEARQRAKVSRDTGAPFAGSAADVKAAFDALSSTEKLEVLQHASKAVGAEVTLFGQPLAAAIKDIKDNKNP